MIYGKQNEARAVLCIHVLRRFQNLRAFYVDTCSRVAMITLYWYHTDMIYQSSTTHYIPISILQTECIIIRRCDGLGKEKI